MPRRVRRLTPAEAAALLEQESNSSESDNDGPVLASETVQDDSDEDAVNEYIADASDESDAEDPPPPISRPQLTKSQRLLDEADLRPHPPSDTGPYLSRDGVRGVTAEWLTQPPSARRRRSLANVLTQAAGVCGPAKNIVHESDAFKLFITDSVINNIVLRTNERLSKERQEMEATCSGSTSKSAAHKLQDVTHTEMCAFLGLCILRGFYSRCHRAESPPGPNLPRRFYYIAESPPGVFTT